MAKVRKKTEAEQQQEDHLPHLSNIEQFQHKPSWKVSCSCQQMAADCGGL